MTTLGQVVSLVRHKLAGAGAFSENVTALSGDMDASTTTVPVIAADNMGPCVVEVGFEQMRVREPRAADGQLVLWPFGRGYNSTTPSEHSAGDEVTVAPRWAASTVASEVNGVLTELYPSLYAVREFEGEYTDLHSGAPFTLPAGAVGVVAVFVETQVAGGWLRASRWRWEPDAGRHLFVPGVLPGQRVRVAYGERPGLFDLTGDDLQDFAAVTGLPDRVADLMALGVAVRLAPLVDLAGNAQLGAAARADQKEQALGSNVVRVFQAQFAARVEQERMVLTSEHPMRLHFEG